jgi:hypothetical protein
VVFVTTGVSESVVNTPRQQDAREELLVCQVVLLLNKL